MSMWAGDYACGRTISREQHLANDWDTFSSDQQDPNQCTDLTKRARVYSDFFVPVEKADPLFGELEKLGYECLFIGAAGPAQPTFMHVRREAIWTADELKTLTPRLLDLCDQFDAAYDGSFIISVDEDDSD